ncbi:molybdate ABC transporter substrate-binding protein [Mycolicibacterium mengxianglii]|uniref:molybdate ABC transporter substrate-binding protein n=1 Tax=Mycolicibacterium mengxianglii TaxID=2736649 RepID=UPI0038CC092F
MTRVFAVVAGILAAAALNAGCSGTATDQNATETPSAIRVFTAASLTASFTELGTLFEDSHPGTRVTFNLAGSSELVTQLTQGAPADVFASADVKNMAKAVDAGLAAGPPIDFAANTLTIVTTPGNPKGITAFADLSRPGTSVVVCAPQVPCGSATETVEHVTGVKLHPVSEESAVTDVLGKITSGQADAGLVYVTDARGAGDKVTEVAFPESSQAVNTYPIAVLTDSTHPATAQEFVDFVTGPTGRKVLSEAGFTAP